MGKNPLPDRFLVNRKDVQEICERFIKSHQQNTILLSIAFAGVGAILSTIASNSEWYKGYMFWLVLVCTFIPFIVVYIRYHSRLLKRKNDLLDEINDMAIKRSDYTGIFLVSRVSPPEKPGMLADVSLLTEVHESSGGDWPLFIKNLEDYEHNGELNLDEVKQAFARKVDGVNPYYLKIEDKRHFSEIKRTSSNGEEKMIRYIFFSVRAPDTLQPVFESKFRWKTMSSLLSDPKSIGYNLDVLTQINNYLAKDMGDTFGKLEEYEPIKIIWNITKYCKYKCDICATYSERKELNENEKCKALLNILSIGRDRIRQIDFSGGDPLTRPEDIDIILKAQSVLGKDKVSVTTTGEGIAFAKSNHQECLHDLLSNCEVTVDEIEEIPDYIRKEGNYYSKNIVSITQNAQAISHLVINVPILRPEMSEKSIRELVDRIAELKVANKSCTLIRLMRTGKMANNYPSEYNPLRFIDTFKKRAGEKQLTVHVQCALRGAYANDQNSCSMFHKKIGIDCAGNVFACAWGGYVVEDVESNPFYLGNVYTKDLNSILEADKAIQIKNKVKKCTRCCRVFNYYEDKINHSITCDMDPLLRCER